MDTLTPNEKSALRLVKNGSDVYDYGIAMALRRLEKRGLVTITKPMSSPSGEKQQPYFGAIARDYKIRLGDKFSYGEGKGVWEVTDLLPGGVVWIIDRARSLQGRRYQKEIRAALASGSYKRVGVK